MSELLPCPFCGGTDLDWTAEAADAVTFYGQIECHTCEAIMHSEECWGSEEDAEIDVKDKWNRRAPVIAPEGFALVPIEPPIDMVVAAERWLVNLQHMRASDKREAVTQALRAAIAAATTEQK